VRGAGLDIADLIFCADNCKFGQLINASLDFSFYECQGWLSLRGINDKQS
jgi:hypothetical protein